MANPDGVYLSVSDFRSLTIYLVELKDWAEAAQECLQHSDVNPGASSDNLLNHDEPDSVSRREGAVALAAGRAVPDLPYKHNIQPAASLVPVLNGARRPTAVSGLVASMRIDAVDRVTRRPLAHIREEVLEGVTPPITDGNVFIVSRAELDATLERHPGTMRPGVRHAVSPWPALGSETSATLGVATGQCAGVDVDFGAAIAPADPANALLGSVHNVCTKAQNSQSAKALAGLVYKLRHVDYVVSEIDMSTGAVLIFGEASE